MPTAPFLALITPIGGGNEQPPYPSQGPGFPTNPIAGPGRPPGWGMANDPGYSPPWATPQPPYPSQGPGFPTHPIAGPGRPPGWGMANDPGYGHPQYPNIPSHPIYFPPGPIDPGYSPPWAQVPDLPPTIPPAQGAGGEPVPVEWKTGWSQQTGWVVVGIPTGPVPTPSSTPSS